MVRKRSHEDTSPRTRPLGVSVLLPRRRAPRSLLRNLSPPGGPAPVAGGPGAGFGLAGGNVQGQAPDAGLETPE